jgi:NAD+ diphosphatase
MNEPVFAGGAIDRATHLRPQADSLASDPEARVLPLWRGKPLITHDGPAHAAPGLGWLSPDDAVFADAADPAVFLGMNGGPRFARDVSHLPGPESEPGFSDPVTLDLTPSLRFTELRGAMADLPAADAGDAATAKGVLEWHRSHPRCARCGAPTVMEDAGWRRGCPECGAKHFPRTDPVVIMLIEHQGQVLLGRQPAWPDGMFSLLAGFMEPGETIEDAVRRETFEEAGIRVGDVAYVTSQPWPFPSSLMIGCRGVALDDAITCDPAELETALWADRAEVAASLAGQPARFTAARRGAVARWMLERWAAGALG